MEEESFLTISQAARSLGVSKDTVRRRIKKGELNAQKLNGPYGMAYYIREQDLARAQQITEVVPVSRQISPVQLQKIISDAVEPGQDEIRQELQELREEIKSLNRQLKESELTSKNPKQPWWKRLFGKDE